MSGIRTMLATCLGILCLGLVAACTSDTPQIHQISGRTMGTSYHVSVVGNFSQARLEKLAQGIQQQLAAIDGKMSTYKPDSELSRFNRSAPGDWFPVSRETAQVVAASQRIAALTQGAFDATVGPLVNLWGFGPDRKPDRVPSQQEIAQTFERVGFRYLQAETEPSRLRKERPVYVDLSGIAKGYAVDRVADYLLAEGVVNHLVEVGGELRASGWKPGQQPWRIAIEAPQEGRRQAQQVIEISGLAVATSGDYRNYFEQDGVRYSHTVDPATGRPITHRLASVTVLHESCMEADALATALTVMGTERGYRFAEQQDLAVQFISKTDTGFAVRTTPRFEALTNREIKP